MNEKNLIDLLEKEGYRVFVIDDPRADKTLQFYTSYDCYRGQYTRTYHYKDVEGWYARDDEPVPYYGVWDALDDLLSGESELDAIEAYIWSV